MWPARTPLLIIWVLKRVACADPAEDKRGGISYLGERARIKRLYLFSIREEGSALTLLSIFGAIWILSMATWEVSYKLLEPCFSVSDLGVIRMSY